MVNGYNFFYSISDRLLYAAFCRNSVPALQTISNCSQSKTKLKTCYNKLHEVGLLLDEMQLFILLSLK
ncbi:MAG: hypothetical protein JWQ66_991 [Mucilaginibacter sp.]|nr:hypothetical protein [Mucilaginibacter sp.]